MQKKLIRAALCCLGLLLTALLILSYPGRHKAKEQSGMVLIRVWVREGESAVNQWLRKRAAAYEKETKARVYVRTASAEEALPDGPTPPDLLLSPGNGDAVALIGYALILRDDAAPAVTPSPTFSLFTRPVNTVSPLSTPAPLTESDRSRPVLTPPGCGGALPNRIASASPLSDFLQGRADAALLTAGQAAQVSFGYRAYALPDGAGMAAFGARALSENGEAFLRYLFSFESQAALQAHGLYSPLYPLYQGLDSLEALIESGMDYPK